MAGLDFRNPVGQETFKCVSLKETQMRALETAQIPEKLPPATLRRLENRLSVYKTWWKKNQSKNHVY